MTTEEHLLKIKAKCEQLLALAEKEPDSFMLSALAGWKSTIELVCMLSGDSCHTGREWADRISKLWPEDYL